MYTDITLLCNRARSQNTDSDTTNSISTYWYMCSKLKHCALLFSQYVVLWYWQWHCLILILIRILILWILIQHTKLCFCESHIIHIMLWWCMHISYSIIKNRVMYMMVYDSLKLKLKLWQRQTETKTVTATVHKLHRHVEDLHVIEVSTLRIT